jgi:hypothetical protein
MSAFVGTKICNETELKTLLNRLQSDKSYYFLRWYHQVSGFTQELPNLDTLPPEGQLFDAEKELRWQWKNDQFHLLFLSASEFNPDFYPISGKWVAKDIKAVLRQNETRFPKKIKGETPQYLAQRYFIDANTGTIHFIALTLNKKVYDQPKSNQHF